MKYGFIITGGEAREQVDLARSAEATGWDGVFTLGRCRRYMVDRVGLVELGCGGDAQADRGRAAGLT